MIKLKLSKSEISSLKQARKKCNSFAFIRRIECILYRGEQKDNQYIKDKLGISFDSITLWVKKYRDSGIEGLLNIRYNERRKSLIIDKIDDIRKHVQISKIRHLKDLGEHIKEKYGINYTISNLSRLAKKNGIGVGKNHQQFLEKLHL